MKKINMNTSEKGKQLIRDYETLKLVAYDDGGGTITIGYGHTPKSDTADIYPVYPGEVITEEEAEIILEADVNSTEGYVNNCVEVEITQNMFDALIDFTFQKGIGTLLQSSILYNLNKGDFQRASDGFVEPQYYTWQGLENNGIKSRRYDEQAMFRDGMPGGNDIDDVVDPQIDSMIKWMEDRKGKVTYSMDQRWGPNTYDCSSAVYYSLIAGGYFPENHFIGNTDTLFNDLERVGWSKVTANKDGIFKTKRGDIFIWGVPGASTGEVGHTGIFYDNSDNIIHCNGRAWGISIDSHDEYWEYDKRPYITIYRSGNDVPTPNPKPNPDNNGDLTWYKGTFYPNQSLPVSADTDPASPEVGRYDAGEAIIYDSYTFANGYAWISYISASGPRHYVAVGPDDGRTDTVWGTGFFDGGGTSNGNLIPLDGVFYPNQSLPVSADTNPASPEIGRYDAGEAIIYDSYVFVNGYAWISYISASGPRHYVAVGPDDGRCDTVWGSGFFDSGTSGGGDQNGPHGGVLIAKKGTFYPNQTLDVSGDTDPASPSLGTYDAGEAIYYDSYIFDNGYAWISYISGAGARHYVAVGPDDGRTDSTWGTGFFN